MKNIGESKQIDVDKGEIENCIHLIDKGVDLETMYTEFENKKYYLLDNSLEDKDHEFISFGYECFPENQILISIRYIYTFDKELISVLNNVDNEFIITSKETIYDLPMIDSNSQIINEKKECYYWPSNEKALKQLFDPKDDCQDQECLLALVSDCLSLFKKEYPREYGILISCLKRSPPVPGDS